MNRPIINIQPAPLDQAMDLISYLGLTFGLTGYFTYRVFQS